jgi:hypothetical protein
VSAALVFAAVLPLTGCGDESGTGPDPDPIDTGVPADPAPGTIQTWAGTSAFIGFNGDGNKLLHTSFYQPIDMLWTSDGTAYVLDWNNHRVRRLNSDNTFQTIMGNDTLGDGPYDLSDQVAPGAPGTSIQLNHPTDILERLDGTILVTCWHNHKLRVWNPRPALPTSFAGAAPASPVTERPSTRRRA